VGFTNEWSGLPPMGRPSWVFVLRILTIGLMEDFLNQRNDLRSDVVSSSIGQSFF